MPEAQATTPLTPTPLPEHLHEIAAQVSAAYLEAGTHGRDMQVDLGALGRVHVRLATTTRGLEVSLAADESNTTRVLAAGRAELQTALSDRGYVNARVEVTGVAPDGGADLRQSMNGNQDGRNAPKPPDTDAYEAQTAAMGRRLREGFRFDGVADRGSSAQTTGRRLGAA